MRLYGSYTLPRAMQQNALQRTGGYTLIGEDGLLRKSIHGNNLKQDLAVLSEFVTPETDTFQNSISLIIGADPYADVAKQFFNADYQIKGHFSQAFNTLQFPTGKKADSTKKAFKQPQPFIEDSFHYNLHLARIKNAFNSHRVPLHTLPKHGKPGNNLHFPAGGLQFNREHVASYAETIRRIITPVLKDLP